MPSPPESSETSSSSPGIILGGSTVRNCNAISKPLPRTASSNFGYLSCSAVKRSKPFAPSRPLRSTRFSSTNNSRALTPIAIAKLLPPKVLLWRFAEKPPRVLPTIQDRAMVAPTAVIPPPRGFARVTMSGSSPAWMLANQYPVRPSPVWISSAIISISYRLQSSLTRVKKSLGGEITPASPWVGSRITAQTLCAPSLRMVLSSAPASP